MDDLTTATVEYLREDVDIGLNGGVHVSDFDRDCANAALAELVRRAEEAATLRTERDRLARVLAVERGDESAAPEGWRVSRAGLWVHGSKEGPVDAEIRPVWVGAWVWSARHNGDPLANVGQSVTALEAMEAADRARGAHHD